MPRLTISLEEGFQDDTVAVSVNGVEAYRRDNITTKLQIGLADMFKADVPAGSATIDVALPKANVSGTYSVETTGDLWVGISLSSGTLRFRHSSRAFGYV